MPDASVGSSDDYQGQLITDPTRLTTDALRREIAHLSDRIDLKIEGVVAALEARLDAIDRATQVFSDNLVRVPTETQKAVGNLQALTEEKFASIARQFAERDTRVEQQAEASKEAIDAALEAAKEAVQEQARSAALATAKSEAAQIKAIEQQGALIATQAAAMNGQIADLKERLTRLEAAALGQSSQKHEQQQSSGMLVSVIGVGVAVISLLIAAGALFLRGGGP